MLERIITAVLLALALLGVMFFGKFWVFLSVLGVLGAVAGYEWGKLLPARLDKPKSMIFGALLGMLSVVACLLPSMQLMYLWAMIALIWVPVLCFVVRYPAIKIKNNLVLGVLLIVGTVSAMYHLWQVSPAHLLYAMLLVWVADSMAYFVGRKWGKTKFIPHVSPNKSTEGLLAGAGFGALVAFILSAYLAPDARMALVWVSVVAILASVLGDLFESMLKRIAGVKDSGRILPGHGGVLDRIDGLLCAMPIFALAWFGVLA